MTKEAYIQAILKKTGLDRKTKARLAADLESDIGARLDAGETLDAVMTGMGSPAEVAEGLARSMGGATPRRSRWRWAVLFLAVALLLQVLYSAIAWCFFVPREMAGAESATLGIIGGADGPTAIFVTSVRVGIPALAALGLALAALAAFLLMQWKGRRRPVPLLVTGAVLVAYAAFLLAGGLSGSMIESTLNLWMPLSAVPVLLSRIVNPAFLAPLALGIVCLRRGMKQRREKADIS